MTADKDMRQASRFIVPGCVTLLLLTLACQSQVAPYTRARDESAIRDLDVQWSKVAAAKDAEGTASYYSDDAELMAPNIPIVEGKQAIRVFWKTMVANPRFAVAWHATKADVARSGDLAYMIGTYELSFNDASGKPVHDRGKYSELWKKQADGGWKVVADMFNSDVPLLRVPENGNSSHQRR